MVPVVEHHRDEIAALCQHYGVTRLELIGSAARGDFDPSRSDLDFLVDFEDRGWRGSADQYFGLLEKLTDLLGRRVDLVERAAVENPLFLEVAQRHRDMLYAG